MEATPEGGNAIQVLLAASTAAHGQPVHAAQAAAIDPHLLSQQYAYEEVPCHAHALLVMWFDWTPGLS